jgi:hypothetical protein
MDQKIDIPNEAYDFSNITLSTPISVYGGAYFTKISNNGNDIYIQTPMCGTKSGVVKSGKRMYIDLLFDKTDEKIVVWFENLEEQSRELIYKKRDNWFQDTIDMDDIESAFTPSVRLYKSGNYYLIRVFLDNPRMYGGSNSVTIYDDREKELSIEDITSESKIICILQIHGIKFTSKSFQVYSQVKQVMVIKNNIFNKCCIKKNSNRVEPNYIDQTINHSEDSINNIGGRINDVDNIETFKEEKFSMPPIVKTEEKSLILEEEPGVLEKEDIQNKIDENQTSEEIKLIKENGEDSDKMEKSLNNTENNIDTQDEIEDIKLDFEDLTPQNNINKSGQLEEFDMELSLDQTDSITLRKPNDVYYDIYKEARAKAKESRKNALQSYIEAQNIKNTHNLDVLNESSDEEYEKQIYSFEQEKTDKEKDSSS